MNIQQKYPAGFLYKLEYHKNNIPNSHIYVLDSRNNCVRKFDSDLNLLLEWNIISDQFGMIANINCDAFENIYISNSYWKVQKFDSNGNFLSIFELEPVNIDKNIHEMFMEIDSNGNIYTSINGSGLDVKHEIQKFDSNGNFLLKFGSLGDSDGNFTFPKKLTVDAVGNIYVVDQSNHRIQKFDSNGNFLLKFGSNYMGDEEIGGLFDYPIDVSINSKGNIYVVDEYLSRIQKFDSNGNFLSMFNVDQYFYGITIDLFDNVYICNKNYGSLYKYDLENNLICRELYDPDISREYVDVTCFPNSSMWCFF